MTQQYMDAGTEFWSSQGGQVDDVTKGWQDTAEAADRLPNDLRDRDARDDHHESVRIATDIVKSRDGDRGDWDSSREHRDWFRERYPTAELNDLVRAQLGWFDAFQRDPAAAREKWIRDHYAQPPFHHQSKPTPKADEPHPDLDRRGRIEWERDNDVRMAVRQAGANKRDAEGYASTSELRQLVKQKTGLSLTEFLNKTRMIDTASLDDPVAVANRFAAFCGMPATEAHAREMEMGQVAEQRLSVIAPMYERIVANGDLPGLGTKAVDDLVVDVLSSPNFVRTQDWAADLAGAYSIAMRELQRRGTQAAPDNRESSREIAERARFASRSVSGSPSPGAEARSTQQHRTGSYDDDLRNDVRRAVGGRV